MTTWYTNHALDQALQNLPMEAKAQDRLDVVWRACEAATGEVIGDAPTDDQRARVRDWLNREGLAGPPLTLTTRRPRFVRRYQPTYLRRQAGLPNSGAMCVNQSSMRMGLSRRFCTCQSKFRRGLDNQSGDETG